MNTSATYLPNTTAKANSLPAAIFLTFHAQNSKIRVWAFAAAVRLSDQNRSLGLKLLVELAIVLRMLALLVHNAHTGAAKTIAARRASHASARVSARRVKSAKRTSAVQVCRPSAVAAQRKLPTNAFNAMGARSRSTRPGEAASKSPEGRVVHDRPTARASHRPARRGA